MSWVETESLSFTARHDSEDAAFAALRSHAMDRGIRLGDAAKQLIDIAALLG